MGTISFNPFQGGQPIYGQQQFYGQQQVYGQQSFIQPIMAGVIPPSQRSNDPIVLAGIQKQTEALNMQTSVLLMNSLMLLMTNPDLLKEIGISGLELPGLTGKGPSGKEKASNYPDKTATSQDAITLGRLNNHKTKAEKRAKSAGFLSDSKNFKKLTTDDFLTKEAAQKYLDGLTDKQSEEYKSLDALLRDGSFDRIAGDDKKITIEELKTEKTTQDEAVKNLTTLTDPKNFDLLAGKDGLLTKDEITDLPDDLDENLKTSAQWLAKDGNYQTYLRSGNTLTPVKTGEPDEATQTDNAKDTAFMAIVRSLASGTTNGREILERSINETKDGWDVSFAGDPTNKTYSVTQADLDKLKNADGSKRAITEDNRYASILEVATKKQFAKTGKGSLPLNLLSREIPKLLYGNQVRTSQVNGDNTSSQIKNFLLSIAPRLGEDQALSLKGGIDDEGNWTPTGDYTFSVSKIDYQSSNPEKATLYYLDPNKPEKERSILVKDLTTKMASGNAQGTWLTGYTLSS